MKVIICCSRLTSFIQTDYSIKKILRLVFVPGTFFSDPCSRTTTTVYQKFHVICSASQLKMQVEPQLDLAVSGCHSHTPPACFFYFFFTRTWTVLHLYEELSGFLSIKPLCITTHMQRLLYQNRRPRISHLTSDNCLYLANIDKN